jgi:hypothetical protein
MNLGDAQRSAMIIGRRGLAILRLVAGTSVTGEGRDGEVAAPELGVAELEAMARKAIYALKPGVDCLTVPELIAELNQRPPNFWTDELIMRTGKINDALRSVGIHVRPARPDDEVDVRSYGVVLEPAKLLRACPELDVDGSYDVLVDMTF